MAKSRKNQGRDSKVATYKQKQKAKNKSMEAPQFKPFRQVPHWEPNAQITLTGTEFSLLQNFFNVFAEPINVMQDIFSRNLNSGTITVKYLDNENKEISKEEVQAYMEEFRKYLQTQAQEAGGVEVPVTPETSIVTSTVEDTPVSAVVEDTTNETPKRKLKVVTD